MKTSQQQKRDEDWSALGNQVVGGESLPPATGSAPVFALSYDDLQEIHTLTGYVCGWHMSLPTKMINQAQEVARRMIKLRQVKAQNDPDQRPATKTL